MDMHHIGKLCDVHPCGVKDYLPFECKHCKRTVCQEHRSRELHDCTYEISCKECKQYLTVKSVGNEEDVVREHQLECAPIKPTRTKKSPKCKKQGCRERMLIPVFCASCGKGYCSRHRFEEDHSCIARQKETWAQNMLNAATRRLSLKA
mmetsp:Transcript_19231/g.31568  ORF Transcript_19231/g.31568 Transcript_19231/m.31568 type:complete len:149 (-) Transcript_19231:53-499(-)